MRRRGLLWIFLGCLGWSQQAEWMDPVQAAPAGSRYVSFFSKTIDRESSYLIYLPPEYEVSAEQRFPVVYWLHGLGGNQRSGQVFLGMGVEAMRAGKAPPAIVVLVNGMNNSMYTNAKDGSLPMEQVIIKDLIPHVDGTYRTIADRKGRAIEGYSMGGFGAARLGLKYAELFGAVSVMAGALHTEDTLAERRAAIFQQIYGGDKAYYKEHSPWTIAGQKAAAAKGTRVRIGVGGEDQLKDWNRQYHELLENLGLKNEFFLVPGVGHNGGQFYRQMGEPVWAFYREVFGAAVP